MEQFDSYNPINIKNILDKVMTQGFISANQRFTLLQNPIHSAYEILQQFCKSEQDSLILFLLDKLFKQMEFKSEIYDYINSLLNSLELYNTKESATIIYLFSMDYCQEYAQFYVKSKQNIYNYTKQPDLQLDEMQVKFNDMLHIMTTLFPEIEIDKLIKQSQEEIQFLSNPSKVPPNTLNPLIEIDASVLLYIMMKILHNQQETKSPFQTPVKQKYQKKKNTPLTEGGIYKWGSPFFSTEEFLLNPANQRMLSEVNNYAKYHPKMRKSTPIQNFISPLKYKKEVDISKDNTITDLLKLKGLQSTKTNHDTTAKMNYTYTPVKKKSTLKDSLSSFQITSSFNKEELVNNSGCLYADQVPKEQQELQQFIKLYKLEYFDPALQLPAPLSQDITYEHLIDLYNELLADVTFRKSTYTGITYFSSKDNRYLKITKNGRVEGISMIQGWILGVNEFGHIGCCSGNYLQRI